MRDPKIDPQPGDHLHKQGKRFWFDRWVKKLEDPDVIYCDQYGQQCVCGLSAWRRWAKTAEVIKRGDDGMGGN